MILAKVLRYVLGKFFELGVLAALLFYVAQLVEPEEYGQLLPLLLALSISSIVFSGLGSSFIKDGCIAGKDNSSVLKDYYVQTAIVGTLMLFFGLFFFYGEKFYLTASFTLLCNAFRSFGQSRFRLQLDEMRLIRFNLIYPISTCVSFFCCVFLLKVHPVNAYFMSVLLGIGTSALYISVNFLSSTSIKWHDVIQLTPFQKWKVPIGHLILNSSVFIFISSDKVLALELMSEHFLGQFQLYENFSNLFYLGVSSCLYLMSPYLLKKYKSDAGFDRKGVFQCSFFITLMVVGCIYALICELLMFYMFPAYTENLLFFKYQLGIKTLALSLFLPSIYFMTKDKERLFTVILYTLFSVSIVHNFIAGNFSGSSFRQAIEALFICLLLAALALNILMFRWNYLSGKAKI